MLGELDAGLLDAGQADEDILVEVELLGSSVDLLQRELLGKPLVQLIVGRDVEEVTTVFEVVYIDVSPSVAGALVTLVVEVLHADEVVLLSAAVFARSEAVLLEADDLSHEGLESRLPLTFLEGNVEVGSILGLSDDVVAEVNGSVDEGSVRLLDDVAEALGDHR